jgi:low affinity Fe/Cu permease
MAEHPTRRLLTDFGTMTSRPGAFLVVVAYAMLWFLFQPQSFDMHAVATLAVWIMTLFIQRAEHRDTQALHAKLDELLHAAGHARNELTKIDNEEPEDIENRRKIDRVYD